MLRPLLITKPGDHICVSTRAREGGQLKAFITKRLNRVRVLLFTCILITLPLYLDLSFATIADSRQELQERWEVTEVVRQFVLAWNHDDATTLSMLFTPDGTLRGPGAMAEHPSGIEILLTEERPDIFLGTDLNDHIWKIRFLTPDLAIVNGQYELSGIRSFLGFVATVSGTFKFQLRKQHGHWYIDHALIKRAP